MTQNDTKITKLHSRFKKHFLWVEKRKFSRFEAWLDLFTEASPGGKVKRVDGKEYTMQPGLVAIGYNSTRDKWGWEEEEFQSFLKLLQDEKMAELVLPMIPRPFQNPIIIVKIVNYKKYHGIADPDMNENGVSAVSIQDALNVIDCWTYHWSTTYGRKPVVTPKNRSLAKELLKNLTKPEIFTALERYFQDNGDFVRKNTHSFAIFYSTINRYIAEENAGIGRTA